MSKLTNRQCGPRAWLSLLVLLATVGWAQGLLPELDGDDHQQPYQCNEDKCWCTLLRDSYLSVTCSSRRRPPTPHNIWQYFSKDFFPGTPILSIVNYNVEILNQNDFTTLSSILIFNLNNNNIMTISPGTFAPLVNLGHLSLRDNDISNIANRALSNMPKLEYLSLRDNAISEVKIGSFFNLTKLVELDLQTNLISKIQWKAFQEINNQNWLEIYLGDNSLKCTCKIKPFVRWLNSKSSKIFLINATCSNFQSAEVSSLLKNKRFLAACPDPVSTTETSTPSSTTALTTSTKPTLIDARRCMMCDGEIEACKSLKSQTCAQTDNVCETTVLYDNNAVTIQRRCALSKGGCSVHAVPGNPMSCQKQLHGIYCTYCCDTDGCNDNIQHRVTTPIEYVYKLRITINQAYINEQFPVRFGHSESKNFFTLLKEVIRKKITQSFHAAQMPFILRGTVSLLMTPVMDAELKVTLVKGQSAGVDELKLWHTIYKAIADMTSPNFTLAVLNNTIDLNSFNLCESDITNSPIAGELAWNLTRVGSVMQPCPNRPGETATRSCFRENRGDAVKWSVVNDVQCKITNQLEKELLKIKDEILKGNLSGERLTKVTLKLMTSSLESRTFSKDEVGMSVDVISLLVDKTVGNMSSKDVNYFVSTLSNVMLAPRKSLEEAQDEKNSVDRLIHTIDEMSGHMPLTHGDVIEEHANLVIAATLVDVANFTGLSYRLNVSHGINDFKFQQGQSTGMDGVYLPPNVLSAVIHQETVRAHFVVYTDDTLFSLIDKHKNVTSGEAINTRVLTASVGDQRITNLTQPVLITMRHYDKNRTSPRCVYWDVTHSTWSNEGCTVVTATESHTVCACDHLTNFALLMDVHGEGRKVPIGHKRALMIISLVGCGVSFGGLLLTIITYLRFRKLRRGNPSKILINLCFALAALNLLFIFSIQTYTRSNDVVCKVIAALLHYFLVSSHVWMAIEAFYMYVALVKVFKTYYDKFLLKCCLIGWGLPLVVVAITLGINHTDNYGSVDDKICWVVERTPFYISVLAPVALIMILNFVAFFLVIKQITGSAKKKLNKSEKTDVTTQLRGAIGVAILLGLTWIFAIFAVGEATLAFQYLFAVFNSLQGLFIFVFYCMLKKDAQNAWIRSCCPGKHYNNSSFSKGMQSSSKAVSTRKLSLKQSCSGSAGAVDTKYSSYSGHGHFSRPEHLNGESVSDQPNGHRSGSLTSWLSEDVVTSNVDDNWTWSPKR